MKTRALMSAAVGGLMLTPAASAQFSIPWSSIDGGAATMTGGGFSLTATIGQPDASTGAISGGGFAVGGGFWQPPMLDPSCNPADLAEPFGLLDLADIVAFVIAFDAQDPAADLDGNGFFDLSDIVAFVTAFTAGCP